MGTPDRQICNTCGATLARIGSRDDAPFVCPSCSTVDSGENSARPPEMQTLPGNTPLKSGPEPVDLPDSGEKPPRELETAIYAACDDSVTAPPQETLDFQRHAPQPSAVGGRQPAHGDGARLTVIGRFVIKTVLGEGSFGTVYRAYDPLLDREVALKVPRFVDDSRATQERFVREAKAAARLRHPNVVAVFESGHADGHPYIATEFVDGTPLSQVLAETPDLDLRRGVEWVRQIADKLFVSAHRSCNAEARTLVRA